MDRRILKILDRVISGILSIGLISSMVVYTIADLPTTEGVEDSVESSYVESIPNSSDDENLFNSIENDSSSEIIDNVSIEDPIVISSSSSNESEDEISSDISSDSIQETPTQNIEVKQSEGISANVSVSENTFIDDVVFSSSIYGILTGEDAVSSEVSSISDESNQEQSKVPIALAYLDLGFEDTDGEKVEPNNSVNVTLELDVPFLDYNTPGLVYSYELQHITEDDVEVVDATFNHIENSNKLQISFSSNSFSPFLIKFYLGTNLYAEFYNREGTVIQRDFDSVYDTGSSYIGNYTRDSLIRWAVPSGYKMTGMELLVDGYWTPVYNFTYYVDSKNSKNNGYRYTTYNQSDVSSWSKFTPSGDGIELKIYCETRNIVKFYINVTYVNLSSDGKFTLPPATTGNWTKSAFDTELDMCPGYDKVYGQYGYSDIQAPSVMTPVVGSNESEFFVTQPPGEENADLKTIYENVCTLNTPGGLTKIWNNKRGTYRLKDFPTDSEILSFIRGELNNGNLKSIRGENGDEVKAEELTPDHFSIRWYCFKYRSSDHWHIDGVLVRKSAALLVEKTFYGSERAIKKAKENFTIDVKSASSDNDSFVLSLLPKDKDSKNLGYTSYDKDTNTYKWVVDTEIGGKYYVSENNYEVPEVVKTTRSQYRFDNVSISSGLPRNWTDYYGKSIEVSPPSYTSAVPIDNYMKICFRNGYIPSNTLLIRSDDNTSGLPLTNTSYRLMKNGVIQTLYRYDNMYYTNLPEGVSEEDYYTMDEMKINASGIAVLAGMDTETGNTLDIVEETVPYGYSSGNHFNFSIDTQDISANLLKTDAKDINATFEKINNDPVYRVVFPHTSDTMEITITKSWGPYATKDQVEFELYQNGLSTGSVIDCPKGDADKLSFGDNWPVSIKGNLAEYTVKETRIGDSFYDDSLADGYRDYIVSTYNNETYDSDGKTTNLDFIVKNRVQLTTLDLEKVNTIGSKLKGAKFGLYSDSGCTKEFMEPVLSDENGKIDFGALPNGIYHMKEISPPNGYEINESIYHIEILEKGYTISVDSGNPDSLKSVGESNSQKYQIVNESIPGGYMPETGSYGTLKIVVFGIMLLFGSCLLFWKNTVKIY